jgi:hypothetical protein
MAFSELILYGILILAVGAVALGAFIIVAVPVAIFRSRHQNEKRQHGPC